MKESAMATQCAFEMDLYEMDLMNRDKTTESGIWICSKMTSKEPATSRETDTKITEMPKERSRPNGMKRAMGNEESIDTSYLSIA
mmetsp:Transcript_10304/g.16616  ORF Transcript_10304/g.16616 Transcript_10304/m.16616 type:complete len:85 (-) Transcript_10304:229-483(-)